MSSILPELSLGSAYRDVLDSFFFLNLVFLLKDLACNCLHVEWFSSDNYLDFNDQVIDHFQNLYLNWLCVVLNGVLFVLSSFRIFA